MSNNNLMLSPFDTLFFRDGKPFSMGEEVWANGLFPPPPSVIYGALRSKYFSDHPGQLQKLYTQNSEDITKELGINHVCIWDTSEPEIPFAYYPCPADIVISQNESDDATLSSSKTTPSWNIERAYLKYSNTAGSCRS